MNSNQFSLSAKNFLKKLTSQSDTKQPINVDLPTKINSGIRNYFYDVSVEGQVVQKKRWLGIWPQGDMEFASKVVERGNILSFIEFEHSIDKDNFWNHSIYAQLVLSKFWTFNQLFKSKLIAKIHEFTYDEALAYYKELDANFYPYCSIQIMRGGEYEWARIKKYPNLTRKNSFRAVSEYDYKNRLAIKLGLKSHCLNLVRSKKYATRECRLAKERTNELPIKKETNKNSSKEAVYPSRISFIDMLKPVDSNSETTLNIIKSSLNLAKAKRNIFSPPVMTLNEKKPKGFNGTVGAMVFFFFEFQFFKDQYSKEDIIEAFLFDYDVEIPKYKGNFDFFNSDYYYNEIIKRLKKLKINKL
jgi:hypothetical protein